MPATQSSLIDEKYYQMTPPRSFGERLGQIARDRIHEDFLDTCAPRPTDTILDLGVSDVVNDFANVLERSYPYPERITAAGLGAAEEFRRAFPAVAYRQIVANEPLPFADRQFDIATSNAVLEHVGSEKDQLFFVAELARVARRAFISVPNRFFPVEHHTAIPLLHYADASFAAACRITGKTEWANTRNLILMSKQRLAALVPPGMQAVIDHTGIPLGAFSSNLYLFLDDGTWR